MHVCARICKMYVLQRTQLTSTIDFLNCSLRYDKLEDYEQSADW